MRNVTKSSIFVTPIIAKKLLGNSKKLVLSINVSDISFKPFKHQPHKMVKHTQTIHRQKLTNCLSVFYRLVGLALKGLNYLQFHLVVSGNVRVNLGFQR